MRKPASGLALCFAWAAFFPVGSSAAATHNTGLIRAGLLLRQKTYSASMVVKKLDDTIVELLNSMPAGGEVLVDMHQDLSGVSADSTQFYGGLGPELFMAREKTEQGVRDIAKAPQSCEAGTLSQWGFAVVGRRTLREGVEIAGRARVRVEQMQGTEERLIPIIAQLRRKHRWDGNAAKLERLRKDFKSSMQRLAGYLDAGLDPNILHESDVDSEPDCPPAQVRYDAAPSPGGSAAPYNGEVDARNGQALAWSADQMPGGSGTGVNRNNGLSIAKSKNAWNSWCLAFVASAYGRSVSELTASSAINSYRKFVNAGKLVNSRTDIPPGAPVFFKATKGNNYWGHIAIFTGRYSADGDPIIRTTGWGSWPGIHEVTLSEMEEKGGTTYTGFGVIS